MFNKWNDILRANIDRVVTGFQRTAASLDDPLVLLVDSEQGHARAVARKLALLCGTELDPTPGELLPLFMVCIDRATLANVYPQAEQAIAQQPAAPPDAVTILCIDGDAAVPVSIRRPDPIATSTPQEQNKQAWDNRARAARPLIEPFSRQERIEQLRSLDPYGWLEGNLRDKRVLCLAGAGGRQSVLLAMAGAKVTVADISPEMLKLDRDAAGVHRLEIDTVEASLDDLSPLQTAEFDVIYQPVSSCYVPNVFSMYREVARVIAPGGIYISQHKQPAALQAEDRFEEEGYNVSVPYNRCEPLPPAPAGLGHREEGMLEFLHTWEALLGGLCRAGFVIEDLAEPKLQYSQAAPGSAGHRSGFLPPFVRFKARRNPPDGNADRLLEIWTIKQ